MHRDLEFSAEIYGGQPIPPKGKKGNYLITSVGFGSAASMSGDLTSECHPYVTTVIHNVSPGQ
jgi:hypothetical protein